MPEPNINMRKLRKAGRKPTAGDVFAVGLPTDDFVFGRVIAGPLPLERAPMPGAYLVYVYRHRSKTPEPDLAKLRPDDLLLAPRFINQLGWTKGYFLPVACGAIEEGDRLPQHCFRSWSGDFLDENGRKVPGPSGPCGFWGLGNHRTLDNEISEALGIPLAPA